jgi:hypothetical protein
MDYTKIYNNIIHRAQNRILEGYIEKHHIIPKCLGGNNDIINLVALTPEEHYLCHLILVKIHPSNRKILHAAKMMSGQGNNKKYGWIKRRISKLGFSDEHKANMSKAQFERAKIYKRETTLEQMQERWAKNAIKREEKKTNAIITALIYAVSVKSL